MSEKDDQTPMSLIHVFDFMAWLFNYVEFDKIKWFYTFTKYTKIYSKVIIYVNEPVLTSFIPLDIECKKPYSTIKMEHFVTRNR